jgi:hypothetical protein
LLMGKCGHSFHMVRTLCFTFGVLLTGVALPLDLDSTRVLEGSLSDVSSE